MTLSSWEEVQALDKQHIWTEETVRERFDWEMKGMKGREPARGLCRDSCSSRALRGGLYEKASRGMPELVGAWLKGSSFFFAEAGWGTFDEARWDAHFRVRLFGDQGEMV